MPATSILHRLVCGLRLAGRLSSGEEVDSSSIPHYRRTAIHDVFLIGDRLGHCGTFGEARSAIHRATGQSVAIKQVRKHKCLQKMLKIEEEAMRVMQHGNITQLYCVYEDRKSVYFVMEKCCGGDLIDVIVQNRGRLCENRARQICIQLASGIAHMHSKGYAHCDIKPSNILFEDGQVKFIDFGVSQPVGPNCTLHAEVGSPSFMAPEVIAGSYTAACDMWSLGVVVFVMLFGFNAFNPRAESDCCVNGGSAQVHRKICARVLCGFDCATRSGYGAFFPEAIAVSNEVKNLVGSLLQSDPVKRLTAAELLKHPWIVMGDTSGECLYGAT